MLGQRLVHVADRDGAVSSHWDRRRTEHLSLVGWGAATCPRGRAGSPGGQKLGGRELGGTHCMPSSPYNGTPDSDRKVRTVPTLGDRPGSSVGHGEDVGRMRWRGPGTGASSWMKFGEDHASPAPYFPPPVPVKSRTAIVFQIFIVNKFCDIAGGFPGARAGAERGARGVSGNGVSGSSDGGSPARAKQERETRCGRSRWGGEAPTPRLGAPSRLRAVARSKAVQDGGAAGGELAGRGFATAPVCLSPAACRDGAHRLSLLGGGV